MCVILLEQQRKEIYSNKKKNEKESEEVYSYAQKRLMN